MKDEKHFKIFHARISQNLRKKKRNMNNINKKRRKIVKNGCLSLHMYSYFEWFSYEKKRRKFVTFGKCEIFRRFLWIFQYY